MPCLGLRSSTFPGPFRVAELQELHALGCRAVELSFNRPVSQLHADDMHTAAALRAAGRDLGMTFTAHAPDGLVLAVADAERSRAHAQALATLIRGAGRFGVSVLVMHPGANLPDDPGWHARAAEHLAAGLTALLPVAAEAGVALAVETPVPPQWGCRFDDLLAAVASVGAPPERLGVCLDTNHLNLVEDPALAARRSAGRLLEVHANDNHGVCEEHYLPFAGVVAWEAMGQALAAVQFAGPVILEPSHFDAMHHASLLAAAAATVARLALLPGFGPG